MQLESRSRRSRRWAPSRPRPRRDVCIRLSSERTGALSDENDEHVFKGSIPMAGLKWDSVSISKFYYVYMQHTVLQAVQNTGKEPLRLSTDVPSI